MKRFILSSVFLLVYLFQYNLTYATSVGPSSNYEGVAFDIGIVYPYISSWGGWNVIAKGYQTPNSNATMQNNSYMWKIGINESIGTFNFSGGGNFGINTGSLRIVGDRSAAYGVRPQDSSEWTRELWYVPNGSPAGYFATYDAKPGVGIPTRTYGVRSFSSLQDCVSTANPNNNRAIYPSPWTSTYAYENTWTKNSSNGSCATGWVATVRSRRSYKGYAITSNLGAPTYTDGAMPNQDRTAFCNQYFNSAPSGTIANAVCNNNATTYVEEVFHVTRSNLWASNQIGCEAYVYAWGYGFPSVNNPADSSARKWMRNGSLRASNFYLVNASTPLLSPGSAGFTQYYRNLCANAFNSQTPQLYLGQYYYINPNNTPGAISSPGNYLISDSGTD